MFTNQTRPVFKFSPWLIDLVSVNTDLNVSVSHTELLHGFKRLEIWCTNHMGCYYDTFMMLFRLFWSLKSFHCNCIESQCSEFLLLCSTEERMSYGFGTTEFLFWEVNYLFKLVWPVSFSREQQENGSGCCDACVSVSEEISDWLRAILVSSDDEQGVETGRQASKLSSCTASH